MRVDGIQYSLGLYSTVFNRAGVFPVTINQGCQVSAKFPAQVHLKNHTKYLKLGQSILALEKGVTFLFCFSVFVQKAVTVVHTHFAYTDTVHSVIPLFPLPVLFYSRKGSRPHRHTDFTCMLKRVRFHSNYLL